MQKIQNDISTLFVSGRKSSQYKNVIKYFITNGDTTIPELAKGLDVSVPTITKIVNELVQNNFVAEVGKKENISGRLPMLYNLNPTSGYFIGVDPGHSSINLGMINFSGEEVYSKINVPFHIENSLESLDNFVSLLLDFIDETGIEKDKILSVCVNISGRVNPDTGNSYNTFNCTDKPLADVLSDKTGLTVYIDNDTRAMAYGELLKGCAKGEKNVIFVNVSWGIGIGIIIDGKIYKGKSGFSGELGHMKMYDNEILCHCGKKGCMETEVSGMALLRNLIKRIEDGELSILSEKVKTDKKNIVLNDIISAINKEDFVCIDALEKMADELGKNLAGVINIFNPDMLVIGGDLSVTGDYVTQPVRMAIKKYSLNLVNEDSKIVTSELKDRAGLVGACLIARSTMFK